MQYSKNSKEQNCVDQTERLKEHLQLPWKIGKWKKHTALKQNIKKTTHALNLDAIWKHRVVVIVQGLLQFS